MTINEVMKLLNRHMARLLCNLEEAGCPAIFRDAVKGAFNWLKSDLNEEFGDRTGNK